MESRSESSPVQPSEVITVDLVTPSGDVYRLRQIGTNELCDIEAERQLPFGELMVQLGVFGVERASLATIRAFIKRALVVELSDAQVGAVIDAVGFAGISGAINKMIAPAHATAERPKRRKTKEHTH